MTPQEIAEYKYRWVGDTGNRILVHSDSRSSILEWLKLSVPKHQWHMITRVEPYLDAVLFERADAGMRFIEWYNK